MIFKPLNRHVEIEPLKEETFGDLPDASFEEKGKVISKADDVTMLEIGDIVYFDAWLVAKYIRDEKMLYLVEEQNVRAIEREQIPEQQLC